MLDLKLFSLKHKVDNTLRWRLILFGMNFTNKALKPLDTLLSLEFDVTSRWREQSWLVFVMRLLPIYILMEYTKCNVGRILFYCIKKYLCGTFVFKGCRCVCVGMFIYIIQHCDIAVWFNFKC